MELHYIVKVAIKQIKYHNLMNGW